MRKRRAIAFVAALALGACAFFCVACGEKKPEEKPAEKLATEETRLETVAWRIGDEFREGEFAPGEKLRLRAPGVFGKKFVGWLEDGKPISSDSEIEYVVDGAAALRAVYAAPRRIALDPGQGALEPGAKVKALLFEELYGAETETENALYSGFGYVLPVPKLENHEFVGWRAGDAELTDGTGRATRPCPEPGTENATIEAVAEYEERPFCLVRIEDESGNAVKDADGNEARKAYIGKKLAFVAPPRPDMRCVGWLRDGKPAEEASVDGDRAEFAPAPEDERRTVSFRPTYAEGFAIAVENGSGSGRYARDETVTVRAENGPGREFRRWTTEIDGVRYAFGRTGDGSLCLVGDGTVRRFEGGAMVEEPSTGADCRLEGEEMRFAPRELERLGAKISDEARPVIRNESEDRFFRFRYVLPAENLSEGEITEICEKCGFRFDAAQNALTRSDMLRHDEKIAAPSLKAIELKGARFLGWNALKDGHITEWPDRMPAENVTAKGRMAPISYKIVVKAEGGGDAFFADTRTKARYLRFGQSATIETKPKPGHVLSGWSTDVGAGGERLTDAGGGKYEIVAQCDEEIAFSFARSE